LNASWLCICSFLYWGMVSYHHAPPSPLGPCRLYHGGVNPFPRGSRQMRLGGVIYICTVLLRPKPCRLIARQPPRGRCRRAELCDDGVTADPRPAFARAISSLVRSDRGRAARAGAVALFFGGVLIAMPKHESGRLGLIACPLSLVPALCALP